MASAENSSSDSFTNKNGHKIFCKYFTEDVENPRALVFIVHGAGEHCLFYESLAQMLKEKNLYVFSHDHQGHGQSEGTRMDIKDVRHYARDVLEHVEKVKKRFPDKPVFLFGYSMGGTVTLLLALDNPDYFAGMVLIGPPVTTDQDSVGPVKIFFGKILARIFPQCPVLALDDDAMCRDEDFKKKCKDDPLVYHRWSKAGWAFSILNALKELEANLPSISTPFLVMHGQADRVVAFRSSEALHKQSSSKDKEIKIFPDAYHRLHSEIEPVGSEARNDIVNWIDQRAPKS